MRTLQLLVIALIALILVGCEEKENVAEVAVTSDSLQSEIAAAEQEIEQLKQINAALQVELDELRVEKEHYTIISHLSYQFVQAHVTGDQTALEALLADHVTLTERDGDLFVSYPYAGEEVEWPVHRAESPYVYQGMVLHGFGYDSEAGTYIVHIQEFFEDKAGESVSPPTFLNLTFQQIEGQWKVVEVTFDV